MKRVIAIVKPFKLDCVVEGLLGKTVSPVTVTEVRGFGRQKGHLELYGGSEYKITFLPKVRLEMIVEDERLEEVLDAIVTQARTRRIGDGKIFVLDAEGAEP